MLGGRTSLLGGPTSSSFSPLLPPRICRHTAAARRRAAIAARALALLPPLDRGGNERVGTGVLLSIYWHQKLGELRDGRGALRRDCDALRRFAAILELRLAHRGEENADRTPGHGLGVLGGQLPGLLGLACETPHILSRL